MKKCYAHTADIDDKTTWQLLDEHLDNVAGRAGGFATVFGGKDWGRCAGMLHDVGKATEGFQKRLEGSGTRVDHSTIGARLAWEHCGRLGVLLAYAIAGHHGGLPDGGEQTGQLHFRLKCRKLQPLLQVPMPPQCCKGIKPPFLLTQGNAGFSLSFFARMIFSCLVDADFLDTEQFCSPEKSEFRPNQSDAGQIDELLSVFQAHMKKIIKNAETNNVNRLRREVFEECVCKASLPRQIFSLTVPTGGGKTYSSMAFALNHAVKNNLRRVIYAIPFTSIIEQNAAVFKKIFGFENVLEHHCNFIEKEDDENRAYNRRNRLATENWDLPIVVTTNVQFFESLFAHKTSRCRKLHNIAGSVIILDEAQAIPTGYLRPCLAVLKELVRNYGCSVVLCTATQPALDDSNSLRKEALPKIQEIVSDPQKLFKDLKRTKIVFIGKKTDCELAGLLDQEQQALCIVSTKPQARSVFEQLSRKANSCHLSTNMYPLHRQRILQKIRDRLDAGKSCRVVSTSLVEAGVDLDFPVVYRAMAGLDSIAQAAGRCNREGKLNKQGKLGRVFVFESETMPSMPWLKRCISRSQEALRSLPQANPVGVEMMRRYFELLYDAENPDFKEIMRLLNPTQLDRDLSFPFREVSEQFRFIEEESKGVIIASGSKTEQLVRELRYLDYNRATLRALQPYTVQVRGWDIDILHRGGSIELINNEIPVLLNKKAYDNDLGLCVDKAEIWDVDQLQV